MNASLSRMTALLAFAGLLAVSAAAQDDGAPASANAMNSAAGPWRTGSGGDPWSAVEPTFPDRESRTLQRPSPVLAGRSDGDKHSWARTAGALAGVTGLIVLLAWGYRALTGGGLALLGKARRPGLIEVISRTALSGRQALCLVRIGPRLVLIGQTHDTLRALDVIEDADLAAKLSGDAARRRADSSQTEFHGWLEREARSYPSGHEAVDETFTPEAGRIASVQAGVQNAIQRRYFVRRGFMQTEAEYGDLLSRAGAHVPRPPYPAAVRVVPAVKAAGVLVFIAHPTGYFATADRRIDYDARRRDPGVENDRNMALQKARELSESLSKLGEQPHLVSGLLVCARDGLDGADGPGWIDSTPERELQFLASHTIHHYAIIALLMRIQGKEAPPEFGIAPSTLAYESSQSE